MAGDEVTITVRVPADLVREARAVAARHDETLSQVVRRALRSYVGHDDSQLRLEGLSR